jgi:NAD dependent epimerase/dehydratase family enzyme
MEAEEINEFVEGLEKGVETHQYAVSFSISVLAVLVALATVLSHRAHTEAVLQQARATDEWNLYQAKKIRQSNIATTSDLLTILAPTNPAAAAKLNEYKEHTAKWDDDLKEEDEKARDLEADVVTAEHHASRYDSAEALLQIAVVLSSVTLLTRQRIYWLMGLALGAGGVIFAAMGLLVH